MHGRLARTRPFPGEDFLALVSSWLARSGDGASAADPADVDFFESKVRPLLAEHCYACHSAGAKKLKGGLLLDSLEAMRKGGQTGPAVVPGKLDESLLIQAVRYDDELTKMPPKGKLPAASIAVLEALGQGGAHGPAGPIDLRAGRRHPARPRNQLRRSPQALGLSADQTP